MNKPRSEWVELYFNTHPSYLNDLIHSNHAKNQSAIGIIETTKSIDSLFHTIMSQNGHLENIFANLMMLNKKIILEAKLAALNIENVTTHPRFIHTFIMQAFDMTLQIMVNKHSVNEFELIAQKLEKPPLNRVWGLLEFIKNVMPFSVASHQGDLIDSDMNYLFTTLYAFLSSIKKHIGINDGVPNTSYDCIWDISNLTLFELEMLQKFKITPPMLTKNPYDPTK